MTARILIVDDNPLNLKLLTAKLHHEYYIVTTATDGIDALEKIKEETPDLVLLDVMMPQMDGFETCRAIRSDPNTAHIPVVMITALSDVDDRVKGLQAGADDFLTKPINDIALMARVRSLLRLKTIMDEWRIRENLATNIISSDVEQETVSRENRTRVLLLDDNPMGQKNIVDALKDVKIDTLVVGSGEQATAVLQDGDFSLVLCSMDLQNEDALHLCAKIRAREETRFLPILLVANESDIDRVSKGLDLGANDYLMRPIDVNELVARTRTQLKQKRTYDQLKRNLEEGLSLALIDPLTGTFNRRYLDSRLTRAVTRAHQSTSPISVMMIDIDFFKKVNDTYGHDMGDRALKGIARIIQKNVRPFDLLARMGGEEFIVVMPDSNLDEAAQVGERLRSKIENAAVISNESGEKIKITVSIGCAEILNQQGESAESVIIRADKALYDAKNSGRNCVKVSKG